MSSTVHPVDERLPTGKLTALGLQHVLVMYAGAVAVPLIIGRALKLSPEQVTMLIQADLFCCGLVTLIQAFGATQWFGIKLPVMMGVTFAAVAPMVAMANATPGVEGAGLIFGAIIGAGLISILLAPVVSRMLRLRCSTDCCSVHSGCASTSSMACLRAMSCSAGLSGVNRLSMACIS